ncbi:hypothetical protein R3W88_031649 [Solanum pinnatisectum]|uniref:PPIase cyclophilin-type domain-containing protein n=1 Tax=Solanum pinnatisectum TaxID=50273 RepID=A0AAV9LQV5_9SOLN|nr:hypothetical protein R3W88_031649 [Solanum pinnatisectum]
MSVMVRTSLGDDSIYKFLYGDQPRLFHDEIHSDLKHSKRGTVAMEKNLNATQLRDTDLDYLDGKHTVFGGIEEGFDSLNKINEPFVVPFQNIRIKHTDILVDPFQLSQLIPDASKPKEDVDVGLEGDWGPMDEELDPVTRDLPCAEINNNVLWFVI